MKKILSGIFAAVAYAAVFVPSPGAAEVAVAGGLTREATVSPGEEIEGRLILRNRTEEEIEAVVYQKDYLFYSDGRVSYPEPGSTSRSNAGWIAFTPERVRIAPLSTDSVFYVMRVPEEADMSGTYWSVLMVEPAGRELFETEQVPGGVGIGLRFVTRQAVQMISHIGDTGDRELRFSSRNLAAGAGGLQLNLDVENTGERSLRAEVWADMFNSEGHALGRVEGGRRRIFPSCSRRFALDLSGFPPGLYSALVIADTGDDDVFGARYSFEIPSGPEGG